MPETLIKSFDKIEENKPSKPYKKNSSNLSYRKEFYLLMQDVSLVLMYYREDGILTTKELRETIHQYITIPDYYLRKNKHKNDEPYYYQIVRNIKSNKKNNPNIINQGYAEDIPNGFRITENGRKYIKEKYKL